MTEDKSGRELTPREPAEIDSADSPLVPVDGESRDVERFSAGPQAHSVGLTEERSAKIVRQSANARNIVFLAILLIALFIPVYWFYESGIPALGTEGRLAAEADTQYVTDVSRGYELFQANCATCHGDQGQGGVGPRLNDQGKLYNALTLAGGSGTGHLNPDYIHNVLNVGGRYVCGDPNSLMATWQQPGGPLNYRQVEELIAWLTASQDVIFEPPVAAHGAGEAAPAGPEFVSGWRDPNYVPGPEDTPVPACWKAPDGLQPAPAGGPTTTGTTVEPGTTDSGTTATAGGTPDQPRQINLQSTASLQFTDENGKQVTQIPVTPGETVEFVVDNVAGFDHNFFIGTPDELMVPFGETQDGITTWSSGVQTYTWTVPEAGVDGLQFACTVPGHYQSMHGDFVIAAPADATGDGGAVTGEATVPTGGEAATGDAAASGAAADSGAAAATAGGTPDQPRQINLQSTASLQFTDENGNAGHADPGHARRDRGVRRGQRRRLRPQLLHRHPRRADGALRRDAGRHHHLELRRPDVYLDGAGGRCRWPAVRLYRARPLPVDARRIRDPELGQERTCHSKHSHRALPAAEWPSGCSTPTAGPGPG